jgi:hypothetical protein
LDICKIKYLLLYVNGWKERVTKTKIRSS